MKKITTSSEEQTAELGEKIGRCLRSGDIVALYGDLGAGKTAFTRGIARALCAGEVSSPTFTLVNEYLDGSLPLYHFDAYRISSDDWDACGFDDYLFGEGVCVIEWSENITDILPDHAVKISISRVHDSGDNVRIIDIDAHDEIINHI